MANLTPRIDQDPSPEQRLSKPSDNSVEEDTEEIASDWDGFDSQQEKENFEKWETILTKSEKRRQAKLRLTAADIIKQPNIMPQPNVPQQATPSKFKTPRLAPLPAGDFKLVLRPKQGINISDIPPLLITSALTRAVNTTWREADIKMNVDRIQNTATISTPVKEVALKMSRVKQLLINNKEHEVELYMLAPDDTIKGQVQGIPTDLTEQEILENIKQDDFEVIMVRRLGKKSLSVVLTFIGKTIPRCVRIGGCNYECKPHRKTVPFCDVCKQLGHRATSCPNPNVKVCPLCGKWNPQVEHACAPTCQLCGGPHLSASKECRKRFITPYAIRQKPLQQERENKTTQQQKRHIAESSQPTRRRSQSKGGTPSLNSNHAQPQKVHTPITGVPTARNTQDILRPSKLSWAKAVAGHGSEPNKKTTLTQQLEEANREIALLKQELKAKDNVIYDLKKEFSSLRASFEASRQDDEMKSPTLKKKRTVGTPTHSTRPENSDAAVTNEEVTAQSPERTNSVRPRKQPVKKQTEEDTKNYVEKALENILTVFQQQLAQMQQGMQQQIEAIRTEFHSHIISVSQPLQQIP